MNTAIAERIKFAMKAKVKTGGHSQRYRYQQRAFSFYLSGQYNQSR